MSQRRGPLALVALCLLGAVQPQVLNYANPSDLATFVNQLGQTMEMSALGIIYRQSTQRARRLDDFIVALHREGNSYFGRRAQVIANELQDGMQWFDSLDGEALILTFAAHINDNILNVTSLVADRRRYCYAIFVVDHVEELKTLFEYLWKQQFLRALVVANYRELYTMMPYPEVRVVALSGTEMSSYFPPRYHTNLHGYKLQLPVQTDIPFTFWYRDPKDGSVRLDGLGGRMFSVLMNQLNVSLQLYPVTVNGSEYVNPAAITRMILDGRFEINAQLLPTFQRANIVYSYPMSLTRRCLIVPLLNEIPLNLYLILPFKPLVWLAIATLILLAGFAFRLWTHNSRRPNALSRGGGIELNVVCVILALPLPCMKHFRCGCLSACTFARLIFIYVPATLLGFHLSQFYSTMLHSLMAVTPYAHVSTSLEAVLRIGRPIMISRNEEDFFFKLTALSQKFESRIMYADPDEFHRNRADLHTAYIYPINDYRWRIYDQQQRFLKHKRFVMSSLCLGSFPLQYQMRENSHFELPLRYYIMRFHEIGLYSYWETATFAQAKYLGLMHDMRDPEDDVHKEQIHGLSFRIMTPLGYLYASGVLLSALTFLCELLYPAIKMRDTRCTRQ